MVNRRLLNWGVFLLAAGGVMLAAYAGVLDRGFVAQALGLWPLLVIAIGIRILTRHTRVAAATGAMAAALPGLMLGGLVVAAPTVAPSCRVSPPAAYDAREGTFDGAATTEIRLSCGEVDVTTTFGNGWRAEIGRTDGAAPVLASDGHRLSIATADSRLGWANGAWTWGRTNAAWTGDALRLVLPTANPVDVTGELNASRGRFDLAGARLGRVDLDVNASSLEMDLTRAAELQRLRLDINASSATVRLPAAASFSGDLTVNAAKLSVCVPDGLGLRLRTTTVLGATHVNGLVKSAGGGWATPGHASATYQADVTIDTNVGSVDINPNGGCK